MKPSRVCVVGCGVLVCGRFFEIAIESGGSVFTEKGWLRKLCRVPSETSVLHQPSVYVQRAS